MKQCSVKWRPSGGRGEFEFVPGSSLVGRDIVLRFEALGVHMPAEVRGVHAQGKPRLRKQESNNWQKLHLPQLVMAVAGLPEPARSLTAGPVLFPLENRGFVMEAMDFDILQDHDSVVVMAPRRVTVTNCDFRMDLKDRLRAVGTDWAKTPSFRHGFPKLAEALDAHRRVVQDGVNTRGIREAADKLIETKARLFGQSNATSAATLVKAHRLPHVDEEEIAGVEGRLLTRVHVYRERDRSFSRKVRKYYKARSGGLLVCEACDLAPRRVYGSSGESSIEVHHKIPIEQLQPDSKTVIGDMAMLCASCHRVVHSERPCLTVAQVGAMVAKKIGRAKMGLWR